MQEEAVWAAQGYADPVDQLTGAAREAEYGKRCESRWPGMVVNEDHALAVYRQQHSKRPHEPVTGAAQ